VRGNLIQRAGLRTPAIGEGIYVSSAQSPVDGFQLH